MSREIHEIAEEISKEWTNVHYTAKPYLDAMYSLTDINSQYGLDSAKSIILYFLSNARSFRGDSARRLKAELNKLIK